MKNKGMLLAICLVIAAGLIITCYTSRATSQKSASLDMAGGAPKMEQAAATTAAAKKVQDFAGETAAAPMDTEEQQIAELAAADQEGAQEGGMDGAVSQETGAGAIISPLSGSLESITLEGGSASETEISVDYRSRLSEIDSQIKKMRTEETDSNTYSVKNTADYEFRLWDGVLNDMYSDIMEQLDDEQKEQLKNEERDWMRVRDASAKEAANKYNGGVLEGVEYMASMASSTRERSYELLEEFSSLLGD